jgi:hypothetical protein
MRLVLLLLALLPCLSGAALAQNTVTVNDLASVGTAKHTVRTASGELYCLSVGKDAAGNRPLLLHHSVDGGSTWIPVPVQLNDATSGLSGTLLANVCALAIDDLGVLHMVWGAYTYPSPYSQWYRNYDPTTGTASAIVSLSAQTGASTGSRTAANQILVDQNNVVWIVAHGPSSWREVLLRSDNPYAAGLSFTNVGTISTSASAQQTDLAIDANGLVHCSYYRNTGNGEYWHRIYDPNTGWQTSTRVGNTAAPQDERGRIVADSFGRVHLLVGVDTGSTAATWSFEYRVWDAGNGWSPPLVVFTATSAQHSGVANEQIHDIAVDELEGTVYLVYRDLAAGGMLRVASKGIFDPVFVVVQDITPAASGQHEYYRPNIRGSLFPAFNNLNGSLDIVYQYRQTSGVPPYQLLHQRLPVGGPSLELSAPAALGTSISVDLSSLPDAGKFFLGGYSWSDVPGTPLPDGRVVPLNLDSLFTLSQTPGNGLFLNTIGQLDGTGQGFMAMVIPPAPSLVGLSFHAGAVAFDATAPSGISTVFPGLTITLQ